MSDLPANNENSKHEENNDNPHPIVFNDCRDNPIELRRYSVPAKYFTNISEVLKSGGIMMKPPPNWINHCKLNNAKIIALQSKNTSQEQRVAQNINFAPEIEHSKENEVDDTFKSNFNNLLTIQPQTRTRTIENNDIHKPTCTNLFKLQDPQNVETHTFFSKATTCDYDVLQQISSLTDQLNNEE
jgi:hypothetical protein